MRGNRLFKAIDRYIGIPLCFILSKIQTRKPSHSPKSILLIKLSALGDTILLIPALRAIRKAYPTSFIGLIATEVNYQVLEGCPYINERIFLDIKNPGRFIGFILNLWRKRFDIAIDFDQWIRLSPILAWLSGAKIRLGFRTEGQHRHYLYTATIEHTRDKHEVLSFLSLLSLLKIEAKDTALEIWLEDKTFLEDFMLVNQIKERCLIGIHPGVPSHGKARQWDKKNYAELSDRLQKGYKLRVVITGSSNETSLIQEIAKLMETKPVIFVGKPLSQLTSLIRECKIFICSNTGIMHLASACGVPIIALHGPTDPVKWGPFGEKNVVIQSDLPCSPCLYLGFEYKCKKPKCMELITVNKVIEAVEGIILDRCIQL